MQAFGPAIAKIWESYLRVIVLAVCYRLLAHHSLAAGWQRCRSCDSRKNMMVKGCVAILMSRAECDV